MEKMKYSLVLVLTFAILEHGHSNDDRSLTERIFNSFNDINRLFEKYVLHVDTEYWKLQDEAESEYDFVIVGGGSAGCVLACRLSEVSQWRVLLLEAGEPENTMIDIPALAPTFQKSKYDWAYRSVEQKTMAFGMEDHKMNIPRGKMLGGSSGLNFMMYVRGNKWDYDQWEAKGNPGWGYKDVLPYFMKSEAAHLSDVDPRYHNMEGYLNVEDSYRSTLTKTFLKGGPEIGLPLFDYNAPTRSFGVSPMQSTTHKGEEGDLSKGLLAPYYQQDESGHSHGSVRHEDTHRRQQESLRGAVREEWKEARGAINSPQLLMLSGIGPKKHLKHHGIKCLKDLPVGKNLMDHFFPDFVLNGTGLLSTIGGIMGVGFVKTNVSEIKAPVPDIEFMFMGGSIATGMGMFAVKSSRSQLTPSFFPAAMGIQPDYYDRLFGPLETGFQWTISPVLMHPKSVGYVKLNSTDPHDPPIINPRYFSDPENHDVRTMIGGIREAQKLLKTAAFREYGAKLHKVPMKGCDHHVFDSDGYWECALRSLISTLYHQIGTAKMGKKDDPTAVVDHRLRVHGVKALRVIDVSVMPVHIAGHPNAAAMMIGRRAPIT
ncbi:hypothetical protein NQ318_002300 [Aromia moschata]|uniref:Glucose-methanol-choline oxidoreductase N-terminal domain-containing protein n=1 Tax=Aromia moschata TaxID=1265417 RepID=A0AAV8Z5R5_9CUCU|nr:hypothetical protein NQ318_002300 [Aromia moschata]